MLMNKDDFQDRPWLYKVNGVKSTDLFTNLASLLSVEKPSSPIEANFPSHEKMMEVLTTTTNNCTFNQPFYHGQPLAVKWDEGRVNRVWYVGFYLTCESNTIIVVDHLAPYKKICSSGYALNLKTFSMLK